MYKSVFSLQAFLLGLLLFSTTTAQVPRVFSVQGVLSGTQFKSEHAHIITTTLYAVDSEDKSLYSQSDTLFIERNGLFTIQIGKDKGLPTSLSFDKQYVVEFTVNGSVMPMRIPLQSVPYAITSEKVSDNSVELRHLSEGLKQQLQIQENSKSDKGENTLANYVGGFRSVISGGDENRTSANFSSILGGYTNNVSGTYGTVAGGQSNRVSGNWSFVGGGQNNRAFGSWSSVTAGRDNMVSSSATYATISGGLTNQVGAVNGTISGGSSNIVTSQGGTVSGGQSNRAMQTFATVSGGQNNIASGQGSVTVGGMNNKSTSQYSIVSGGSNNEANGNHAIVSGGMNNDANAEFSSIAGGSENIIASNAKSSFISGGSNNKINSGMNSGIMGSNNTITSSNHSFTMGTGNSISNASNAMAIGTGNQVSGQNATAIGIGNIANANIEFVIGSYASTSSNPANSSNPSFTGNKRFSVGIGSSASQRKNAITVFENGNTLFHGKVLTTETAFLNSAEIINDVSIGGNLDVVGDATVNGTLNATGQFNASNLSGTNTGDITIGTANGLSLSGQTLSLSTATTTTAGAMSASDKTKLDGIATGAEVNVNADWNAVSGDAEILNKPNLGTMSAETASDYYTKTQTDAGFQVQDTDLTTISTIGTSDQLLKVKNDGSGLEWFTPSYISSYTETDPQVGTIASNGVPRWNGTALVTGSLSDDGTNLTTSGTITSSNLSGTNTGDITIGTASGLSLTGQVLSLATATTTDAGAMSASDKVKLNSIATSYFGMPSGKRYLEYNYTGNVQLYIVPSNIYKLQLEVWGSGSTGGGYGGYASCFYYCNPGDTLRVYVGGRNTWNGGGFGLLGNGGDGTDIRINSTLNDRIIVAGGGGGGRPNLDANYPDIKPGHGGGGSSLYVAFYYSDILWNYVGGQGGRRFAPKAQNDGGAAAFTIQGVTASGGGGGIYNGGGGLCYVNCPGIYVNNGSLGKGGDGTSYGGGGGYYGGGGISGNNDSDNGGGGSSWVSPVLGSPPVNFSGGINIGLGKARISW